MIQSDEKHRFILIHCLLLLLLLISNISTQICQNDIPDFFYNVSSTGPLFDQSIYTITTSNFSVASPNGTTVFTFNVQPQTIYSRPSFVSTSVTGRALNNTPGIITVTTSNPSFAVTTLSNGSYALVTNTYPLNYFSPYNRYLFNLIATQTFSNRPRTSSTALVQINLENYNVHAPIFTPANQIFSISETALVGSIFGTVYATDADNDSISYSISSSQFSIESSTGVLKLQQTFQASPQSQYFVTVTASDDGSSCLPARAACPRFSTTTTITINVTAVNKRSPQFQNNICGTTVSFYESNAIGSNVTAITVFDDDRGDNGQITISFPSEQSRTTVSGLRNTAYSQFYIQQLAQVGTTRTAYLRTNVSFDYDAPGATRVWYLFILATDNGTPQRQSFCSLRINLLDLNDNPPVFVMTTWNYTIYRSQIGNSNSARFLRIIASDADSGPNGLINYYIGTLNVPYFTINQTTGTIILSPGIAITDLNVTRFPITFQVYAQDRGSPPRISETNATVMIYYDNGNGAPPARWLDPRYEELNFPIIEKYYETYGDRPIFNDTYGFNGTILYQLTSQTSSILTVSSPFQNSYIPFSDVPVTKNGNIFSSGIVVTSGLHAEIQNLYLIYIRVLVNPPLIGAATISIIDQNDQIPTFDIRSITLSVVENESGTRTIAQIQAFDRDVDYPNNYVQYRLNTNLTDVEAIGNFFVASNGTIYTTATFDRESNKTLYRIFITAYDGAPAWNSQTGAPNTQDFQFDVQVIDVNDVPPVFINSSSITISINETTANGTGILNLTITDTDFNTILDFGILSGNLNNVFSFNLLSDNLADSTRTQYQAIGQLYVVGPLSYEARSNYTLVLFVFDTQNLAQITVTVNLIPQNTKAPYFTLNPGFTAYQYSVTEGTAVSSLGQPFIQAIDPDIPPTSLVYNLVTNTNNQYNLNSIYLNQANNQATIGIASPGLSRDLPFGAPSYNFTVQVTDEGGLGVSSYAPVSIQVTDINNNAPIPTNSPWYMTEGQLNPTTTVIFTDYDDPAQNNTVPFRVQIVSPTTFTLSGPTLNYNGVYTLTYSGTLNRTLAKNLTVTFNASDNRGLSAITTIPIIVADVPTPTPISDGYKTITVLYANGYGNSLRNVPLGLVYVNDADDWFVTSRTYSVRDPTNAQTFSVVQGQLTALNTLYPGGYTVQVDVTKPIAASSAVGTVDLGVTSVDSEYVRQAATIRIQGEYPETLIDSSLGNRLNTLRNALASFLLVNTDAITIIAIRPVYQYRSPYYPPLSYDQAKQQALTDVVFYVSSMSRGDIENTLNTNLGQFATRFGITANASGPNPCTNYVCPTGTICRPTRTIQPLPYAIDTNQTSFVGINVVDSADCVNATYSRNFTNTQTGCVTYSFNNLTYCPCPSLQSLAPLGPYCQVLGRTFNENGGGYAVFDGTAFSNRAPTRFSFDFAIRPPVVDGLILLYGRNTTPINDFFWTAVEIYQSRLRFQFRDTILDATNTQLNASTWYHVEYQYVGSTILVTVNDCQYVTSVNDTLNTYDLSNVQLYLGGLPVTGSLVSGLYPSLSQVNTFSGCIRNVLSNGYYIDMNQPLASANSNAGQCPCSLTNSCVAATLARASDIIVPWYTWLIIALVLLLLSTIIALGLLHHMKKRQKQKTLAGFYSDDARDNIIDYKETAGEEDHSTYNLGVLKKPVYAITDEEIIADGGRAGLHNIGYTDTIITRRPALGDYIDEKLTEQQVAQYANDTQLHYRYEGEGSIASDLSSIESIHYQDEHDFRFLYSWGPKFSRLADLFAGGVDDNGEDFDHA